MAERLWIPSGKPLKKYWICMFDVYSYGKAIRFNNGKNSTILYYIRDDGSKVQVSNGDGYFFTNNAPILYGTIYRVYEQLLEEEKTNITFDGICNIRIFYFLDPQKIINALSGKSVLGTKPVIDIDTFNRYLVKYVEDKMASHISGTYIVNPNYDPTFNPVNLFDRAIKPLNAITGIFKNGLLPYAINPSNGQPYSYNGDGYVYFSPNLIDVPSFDDSKEDIATRLHNLRVIILSMDYADQTLKGNLIRTIDSVLENLGRGDITEAQALVYYNQIKNNIPTDGSIIDNLNKGAQLILNINKNFKTTVDLALIKEDKAYWLIDQILGGTGLNKVGIDPISLDPLGGFDPRTQDKLWRDELGNLFTNILQKDKTNLQNIANDLVPVKGLLTIENQTLWDLFLANLDDLALQVPAIVDNSPALEYLAGIPTNLISGVFVPQ